MTYTQALIMQLSKQAAYTVLPGDNPWKIQKKLKLPPGTLLKYNPGMRATALKPGQLLQTQLPATYKIAKGDTLYALEKRLGIPYGKLTQYNPGIDSKQLKPGQLIQVQAPAPTTSKPQAVTHRPVPKPVTNNSPASRPVPKPVTNTPAASEYPASVPLYTPAWFKQQLMLKQYMPSKHMHPFGQPQEWSIPQYIPSLEQLAIQEAQQNPRRPYSRTYGNSTAYGPLQVTQLKASDYMNRFAKTMSPFQEFFNGTLNPMYNKFKFQDKKRAAEPEDGDALYLYKHDPEYTRGGSGDPLDKVQRNSYRAMADRMLQLDYDRVAKSQQIKALPDDQREEAIMKGVIKAWRGVGEAADKPYYNKVMNRWRQLKAAQH